MLGEEKETKFWKLYTEFSICYLFTFIIFKRILSLAILIFK